jgi:hypothetical protein
MCALFLFVQQHLPAGGCLFFKDFYVSDGQGESFPLHPPWRDFCRAQLTVRGIR